MSYGKKYYFSFDDIHPLHKATWKVDISFKDFTGDAIEIEYLTDTPLTFIRGKQSDDKFEPILGSEADLGIMITDESVLKPEDFIFIDEDAALVEIYKNDAIYWKGFIKQDFIQYPYTAPPYPLTIPATDRIAMMKSHLLDIQDEINGDGFVLLSDLLLSKGLYKTNLCSTLKLLSSLVHPTPTGMTYPDPGGAQLSFFDQIKLRYELLMDDTGYPINIYDTLVMLARSFGARIFYSNNSYHFQRIVDMFTEKPKVAIYTDQDYPDSRSQVAIRKILKGEISSSDAIYVNNDAFFQIVGAHKQEKLDIDYILRGYLLNFQWAVYNEDSNGNGSFDHWTIYNGYNPKEEIDYSPYIHQSGDGSQETPYCLSFKPNASNVTWLSQFVQFSGTGVIFTLKFKVKFFGLKKMAYQVFLDNTNPDPNTYKKLGYANGDWIGSIWPPGYGGWNQYVERPDDLRKNEVDVEIELPKTHTILLSGDIPSQDPNEIQIILIDPDTAVNDGTASSDRRVEIYSITLGIKAYGYTGEINTMRNSANYSILEDYNNAKLIDSYDALANSIHYGDYGVYNSDWGVWHDDFNNETLINDYVDSLPLDPLEKGILKIYLKYEIYQLKNLRGIINQNRKPSFNMTATLYSNTLEFENVIKANDDKLYLQMYDEYNVRMCTHKMQLLELINSVDFTSVNTTTYKF